MTDEDKYEVVVTMSASIFVDADDRYEAKDKAVEQIPDLDQSDFYGREIATILEPNE